MSRTNASSVGTSATDALSGSSGSLCVFTKSVNCCRRWPYLFLVASFHGARWFQQPTPPLPSWLGTGTCRELLPSLPFGIRGANRRTSALHLRQSRPLADNPSSRQASRPLRENIEIAKQSRICIGAEMPKCRRLGPPLADKPTSRPADQPTPCTGRRDDPPGPASRAGPRAPGTRPAAPRRPERGRPPHRGHRR